MIFGVKNCFNIDEMILDLQNAIAINPIDFNRFGEQFYECY